MVKRASEARILYRIVDVEMRVDRSILREFGNRDCVSTRLLLLSPQTLSGFAEVENASQNNGQKEEEWDNE